MSQYFEKFGNDKFQLVDYRTSLKRASIEKLLGFFKEERSEDEAVLIGYVAKIAGKLFEVTSSEMLSFLEQHRDLVEGLVKNVGDNSVAKLLVSVMGDNFVVREKKAELRSEELAKSRSLEMSYGKGFDSRSKNKLFRDCSETLFDFQKNEIVDVLEKGNFLLLKDTIKEEIQDYQDKLSKGTQLLKEIFSELLAVGRMEPSKTGNMVKVIFEVLSKLLDIVCEEVGIKGVNTYMNRANR